MRAFHSGWTRLLRQDDLTATFYTTHDCRAWVDEAIDYSITRRLGVVFDTHLNDPDRARAHRSLHRGRLPGARRLRQHPVGLQPARHPDALPRTTRTAQARPVRRRPGRLLPGHPGQRHRDRRRAVGRRWPRRWSPYTATVPCSRSAVPRSPSACWETTNWQSRRHLAQQDTPAAAKQLAAIRAEGERRAELPAEVHQLEAGARAELAEHAERQRQHQAERGGAHGSERPAQHHLGRDRDGDRGEPYRSPPDQDRDLGTLITRQGGRPCPGRPSPVLPSRHGRAWRSRRPSRTCR